MVTLPPPFLEVHVRSIDIAVGLSGVCAGYEQKEWRARAFARYLMQWLPDFALSQADRDSVGIHNIVELVRKAARIIYNSEKYSRRGEFGELILHAVACELFGSVPAISKIYFKDSPNDPIKGFDAVHVVEAQGGDLELWLGEAKFYSDVDEAIREVCDELQRHTSRDYLRTEFLCIDNKIDKDWKHAAALKALIHEHTSLDKIFARCRIPILLTYDSDVIASSTCCDDDFAQRFEKEVTANYQKFRKRIGELPIHVELVLLPLRTKAELVELLHNELQLWQKL